MSLHSLAVLFVELGNGVLFVLDLYLLDLIVQLRSKGGKKRVRCAALVRPRRPLFESKVGR